MRKVQWAMSWTYARVIEESNKNLSLARDGELGMDVRCVQISTQTSPNLKTTKTLSIWVEMLRIIQKPTCTGISSLVYLQIPST